MNTRFTRGYRVYLAVACLAVGGTITIQAWAGSLDEALTGGTASLDIRMRYENVDQDNALDSADALTVRTRLGYMTGDYRALSAFVEMENTTALIEDYNSGPGGNGKSDYAIVADPELTEVNQAFLKFSGVTDTLAKLGRQRIIHDNARFVGNVGWRQNEQTYDAFRLDNETLPDTRLSYAYLDNVRDIFGNDTDVGSHLLNARYDGLPLGALVAYGYFTDFKDAPANSQQTLGLRFAGTHEYEAFKLLYTLEAAQQSDYEDGDSGIDAAYRLLELGVTIRGITGKIGYELLGGDDFSGFETPLATKHAFNGWADMFLNTPTDGLQDTYLQVGGKWAGTKLLAVYHDFQADKGSADYGTEVDLLAARKFAKRYTVGLKYAGYRADTWQVDTDKFWLWGELKI
ncbi:MAG TPA: hypothetical protein ENJ22_05415 [Gammaproteobacteria bacterium]|nr:hypothetical protein [Gammaproteobacteria bacterium]